MAGKSKIPKVFKLVEVCDSQAAELRLFKDLKGGIANDKIVELRYELLEMAGEKEFSLNCRYEDKEAEKARAELSVLKSLMDNSGKKDDTLIGLIREARRKPAVTYNLKSRSLSALSTTHNSASSQVGYKRELSDAYFWSKVEKNREPVREKEEEFSFNKM